MSPSAERITALVRRRAPRCGVTRLVCVDGRSGSGKTTWAAALADVLGGAPVVHMDDLYPGWDGLDAGAERLLAEVVAPLSRAESARYRRWDWAHDRPGEPVHLGVPETLIVEGAGAGAAGEHAVLTVFLDVPTDLRRRRALARDGDTYAPHWDRWARQEDAYLRRVPVRERADLVLSDAVTR